MTQSSPATPRPETPRHDGFTPERQAAFLDALAATGSISAAAQAVGLSRTAIYNLRNREDEAGAAFRAAWDDRLRQAVAVLAETAFDRAINGVEEPVFHKGEQVGTRVRHNDRLLMFMLKALDRENYGAQPRHDPLPSSRRKPGPINGTFHKDGFSARLGPDIRRDDDLAAPSSMSTSSTAPESVAEPDSAPTSSTSAIDPETGMFVEPTTLRDDPAFMAAMRDLRHPPAPPILSKRTARRLAAKQKRAGPGMASHPHPSSRT